MDQHRIGELSRKWITGTITPEEKAEFLEWYRQADDGQPLHLPEGFATDEVAHGMRMFKNIYEKTHAAEARKNTPFIKTAWFRYAAAALLVIAAGLYMFSLRSGRDNGSPVAAVVQKNADVKPPDGVNAVITLADGTNIILDSLSNGRLALKGNVQLTKMNDGQIVYQSSGNEVSYNTLTNPRGSKVIQVTLADGTRVWLNAESSIRYPTSFAGNERRVEVTGETYFEVARDEKKPFRVRKQNMEVAVTGTHFNLNAYDEEEKMEVTLLEGSVKVSSDNNRSVSLTPGEQSQLGRNGSLEKVKGVDVEGIMAWKNGKFDFGVKSDLGNIMRQIARWYNLEIEYRGNINKHFGGSISRDVNLSQVLKVLEATGDVKFQVTGKRVTVMP